MMELMRTNAQPLLMLCSLLTVGGVVFGMQLMIRGAPTYREYCDLEERQMFTFARIGTALLVTVGIAWCSLIYVGLSALAELKWLMK